MDAKVGPEMAVIVLLVVAVAIVMSLWYSNEPDATPRVPPPEHYRDLEFSVLHRPHLTYLIDRRYRLCFATRKPNFEDLAQFACPAVMLSGEAPAMPRRLPRALDAGVAPILDIAPTSESYASCP